VTHVAIGIAYAPLILLRSPASTARTVAAADWTLRRTAWLLDLIALWPVDLVEGLKTPAVEDRADCRRDCFFPHDVLSRVDFLFDSHRNGRCGEGRDCYLLAHPFSHRNNQQHTRQLAKSGFLH
jgi:hypothetical protein